MFSLNYGLPAEQLKFAGLTNVILCVTDCSSHCQKNNLEKSLSEAKFEVWQYQGSPEKEGIGYRKAFLGFQKQKIQIESSIDNVLYLVAKLSYSDFCLLFICTWESLISVLK